MRGGGVQRRWIAVVATAAVCALAVGCGSSDDNKSSSTPSGGSNAAKSGDTGATLTMWTRAATQTQSERFVKAYNSVGKDLMINPQFQGGKPTIFICGNDEAAKQTVRGINDQFGWETADMGKAEAARAIEPLCMLWLIPGFLRNEWSHAFKLLK